MINPVDRIFKENKTKRDRKIKMRGVCVLIDIENISKTERERTRVKERNN